MSILKRKKKPAVKAVKATKAKASKPAEVKSQKSAIRSEYINGANYQTLADKYRLTTAEVAEIVGA